MSKENKNKVVLKVFSSDEEAERFRNELVLRRTPTERFDFMMRLMKIAYMLNGGRPFKELPGNAHIIKVKPRES